MIAQSLNPNKSHVLTSKDTFEEIDNVKGFLKQMMSTHILNTFQKNGTPDHELPMKVGDVCLIT